MSGRKAENSLSGSSAMGEAYGARVSMPVEGRSLFFLIGRAGPPDVIVRDAGGVVVTRLPDPRRVLAVLPLAAHAGLLRHPDIELAGPVSIDAERFSRFARMVGLDEAHPP